MIVIVVRYADGIGDVDGGNGRWRWGVEGENAR